MPDDSNKGPDQESRNDGGQDKKNNTQRRKAKTLVMWVVLIMLSMVFVQIFFSGERITCSQNRVCPAWI